VADPIKAITFDFDGVVLESADVKTDAFVELFAAYGPAVQAQVKAHHLANTGISRFKKFAWIHTNLLDRSLSEAESRALGDRFSALVLEKVIAAPFVDGARDALAELSARFPLFVASGTPQDELDLVVDRRGLRAWFVEVHGTPREKPEILADVIARRALRPRELLFIGDGRSDHQAAVATGVEFLARTTPDLDGYWREHGVRRVPDLVDLAAVVAAW
jgi:phosphoglycolate phosphatase-like HAD superfamily hydrolase